MSKVNTWSVEDVVTWLRCLGFGDKSGPFEENDIDGSIILTLTNEELTEDLGFTKLQARRIQRAIDFTKDISESGVDKVEENEQKVKDLREEYELLKRKYYEKNDKVGYYETKIKQLKEEKEAKEAPPIVEAVPHAPPKEEQHHQNPNSNNHRRRAGPGVVGGAATGAAGGALKGAIVGAILPGMDAGGALLIYLSFFHKSSYFLP